MGFTIDIAHGLVSDNLTFNSPDGILLLNSAKRWHYRAFNSPDGIRDLDPSGVDIERFVFQFP